MRQPEQDLMEYLEEQGRPDLAELVRPYRCPMINIRCTGKQDNLPVGTSKMGGTPDLPPSVPYPTMSGYTGKWNNCNEERYEECAMQLVAQFNLAELAPYDKENLLPHTGMLYFFWSGEIFPIHSSSQYYQGTADNPQNTAYNKVIWFNGDLSELCPTPPPKPYYTKYFTEAFKQMQIAFSSGGEYPNLLDVFSMDEVEAIEEVAGCYDLEYLSEPGDKLFGFPTGGNKPDVEENEHLLFQYDYGVGCLWNLFWLISDKDLKNRNFNGAWFSFDMD